MRKTIFALIAITAVVLPTAAFTPASAGNQSATGDYTRSNGSHMTINAIKHKDGTTTGGMLFRAVSGRTITVAVDSLTVIGNNAYIHGIVTASTLNPGLVGFHSYHRVVDNGEGGGAEPDRASFFNNFASPPADPLLGSTFAILDGNIQVRDGS